jgi:hypothetical protein
LQVVALLEITGSAARIWLEVDSSAYCLRLLLVSCFFRLVHAFSLFLQHCPRP